MTKLPKVLKQEPLIDALFEVRLEGATALADILPGFLFHELEPKPTIKRLPAAELPQPIRAADPNLQFTAIQRLEWDKYYISVGDRNIQISCKLPYPKWPDFKKTILDITERIASVGIINKVLRYSVKYVNLIEAPTPSEQLKKINMAITLGDIKVDADRVKVQVHREEQDIVHILSVTNSAISTPHGGKELVGVVVDIDSIRNVGSLDFTDFAASLEPGLEQLRQANKEKFFGCLHDATIEEMGPIYE